MQMEYLKKIIQSDRRNNDIFSNIMEKDQRCWKKFNSPDEILLWLHNFKNEREIYLALVLANNILYYTSDQIKFLWRLILMNRVKLFLLNKNYPNKLPFDIEEWFSEYLKTKCLFVGFGRASKSGQSIVYPFKQSISQYVGDLEYMELFQFLNSSEELSTRENIFLLDDFIGSGDQAQAEWHRRNNEKKNLNDIHKENSHLKFIYLALVGCKEGKERIEKNTPMKVILGEELDERFKCFSDVSVIYQDSIERVEAKRVMEEKGRILYEYPLGYGNMQLAIAFCHNTPDDSLPVIWKRMADGSWHPLFERFE